MGIESLRARACSDAAMLALSSRDRRVAMAHVGCIVIDRQRMRERVAMLRAVVRLLKCRLFGHRYRMISVPISVDAAERFGEITHAADALRPMFEAMVRIERTIEAQPRELRCVRCFVRMVPRAVVVDEGSS